MRRSKRPPVYKRIDMWADHCVRVQEPEIVVWEGPKKQREPARIGSAGVCRSVYDNPAPGRFLLTGSASPSRRTDAHGCRSCGADSDAPAVAGWYPLVTHIDAQLAQLDPEYELHQVKEKFGGLRYYAHTSSNDDETQSAFWALIDEAEKRSEITCERCGAAATPCRRGSWFKTLCPRCAADLGYSLTPGQASSEE